MTRQRIEDPIEQALEARLLGAAEFDTTSRIFDKALYLQYRVQLHVRNGESTFLEALDSLINDCEALYRLILRQSVPLTISDHLLQIVKRIHLNCRGTCHFYAKNMDYKRAFEQSFRIWRDSGSSIQPFTQLLNLECLYYLNDRISFSEIEKLIPVIPKAKHALIHEALQRLFSSGKVKLDEQNCNITLGWLMRLELHELGIENHFPVTEDLVWKHGQALLKNSKFPLANESNNHDLDEFHLILQHFFQKNKLKLSKSWDQFFAQSMRLTFQSENIAMAAMYYYGNSTQPNPYLSILNFNNFWKYNMKDYQLNDLEFHDPISVIEGLDFILRVCIEGKSKNDIDGLFSYSNIASQLEANLVRIYDNSRLPLDIDCKLVLPLKLSRTFISSWTTLYEIKKSSLSCLLNNEINLALQNGINLTKGVDTLECQDLLFRYALNLAYRRNLESAIKILEDEILAQDPLYYKAWHLLALCRSVDEDLDASYKITCSVLDAIRESDTLMTSAQKEQYVQLKITQVCIVERKFGVTFALDMIGEVWELYVTLMDPKKPRAAVLKHEIWCYIASLYLRSNQLDDVIEALDEAKKCIDYETSDYQVIYGNLLFAQQRYQDALKIYEMLLGADEFNIEAILGLARLVCPDNEDITNNEVDLNKATKDYYTLTEPAHDEQFDYQRLLKDLFPTERDHSAAKARLELLIKCAIKKSIPAYHNARIWWYLASLHEKSGGQEYKLALLNCIKYQESEPIRDFSMADY